MTQREKDEKYATPFYEWFDPTPESAFADGAEYARRELIQRMRDELGPTNPGSDEQKYWKVAWSEIERIAKEYGL